MSSPKPGTIQIIPAIDLLDGKVVRLEQGRRDRVTVYNDNPADQAMRFMDAGAGVIHVVDLNGAFDGRQGNEAHIQRICELAKAEGVEVQLGGGIRTLADGRRARTYGVKRVIVGTKAVTHGDFLWEFLQTLGAQSVAVGIDARDGRLAIHGWTELSNKTAIDFAREIERSGVKRIVYTDIATDGMLTGPPTESLRAMAEAVPAMEVVASGGISSLDDVRKIMDLRMPNIVGIITGRAIYDGRLDLAQAVRLTGIC